MNFPSGDQMGFVETESVSRTGGPPASGILNTRVPVPAFAAMAMNLPSGDHDAAPRTSSDSASGRASAPFDVAQNNVDRPARRTGKQTCVPSGDGATAPTTAPCSAFHTSVEVPADDRQNPSAPARDARYHSTESRPNR